jgi:hypothetical protein
MSRDGYVRIAGSLKEPQPVAEVVTPPAELGSPAGPRGGGSRARNRR